MELNLTNYEFVNNSIKRIGYSTLEEFIKMIKKQNKTLKKLGVKVQFTITLPIKSK